MNKSILIIILTVAIIAITASCNSSTLSGPGTASMGTILEGTVSAINTQASQVRPESGSGVPDVESPSSTASPQTVSPLKTGPDEYSPGVNPLTGLLISNPDLLKLPPALISISNFPPSARKLQGGLSTAAQVFEVYIGEGMTRFLAIFYGAYPDPDALQSGQNMNVEKPTGIGPIRSGRTAYETIRAHLNGFLVMASADKNVRSQLTGTTNIFGSDEDDINSAMIDVSQLVELANAADQPVSNEMLSGNYFGEEVPGEGQKAEKLWVFYNALDQVLWEYRPELGGYYRYQDNADESGEFMLSKDAFTGEPLVYENVIVLFAEHQFLKPTLINIDLDFVTQGKALLLRDGLLFKINWTTRSEEYEQITGLLRPIRFVDAYNQAFPLKPGQTWVHLVDINHRYWEANPAYPFELLPGSGFWSVRFYDPTQN